MSGLRQCVVCGEFISAAAIGVFQGECGGWFHEGCVGVEGDRVRILRRLMRGERLKQRPDGYLMGCDRMAARVEELRKRGIPVVTEMVWSGKKGGRVALYSLEDDWLARHGGEYDVWGRKIQTVP